MQQLLAELSKAHYHVNEVIPDGKFHRFKTDDRDTKMSGYYKAFANFSQKANQQFFVMIYGSWKTGEMATFNTLAGIKLDKQDRARIKEQMDRARAELELERTNMQIKAAEKAEQLFNSAKDEFGSNKYLEKKGITELYGARLYRELPYQPSILLVPMRDNEGKIWNVERIFDDGAEKKGLFGGKRDGLYHVIGSLGEVIYICEGFSTGIAIHRAMQTGVVVSFNANNLPHVAREMVKKCPTAKIVICGDDDRHTTENIGAVRAKEAASQSGGKFILPEFSDDSSSNTDFDDLARIEGIEAVKNQILEIKPLEQVDSVDENYIVNAPYPDENIKTQAKKGTYENVCELLRRLRIIVRYNVISKEEEILIPGLSFTRDNQANAKFAYIVSWCNKVGIPTGDLVKIMTMIAEDNLYNPVATWIESKPWDGVSRVAQFYGTIIAKNEKTDPVVLALKNQMMMRWAISAIAAAYEPRGVSAHGVLVLQGEQNLGKTHWFKNLVPSKMELLRQGATLDPSVKDSVMQVISYWLVELGEIDATLKSDMARIKAFITLEKDVVRRAYAAKDSCYDRRTVFFGSVNEDRFLKDTTGNRRFWTISCESINYAHGLDMQQVWAEFAAMYKSGESWYLSSAELDALNKENEKFQEVNPVEELINRYFERNSGDFVKTNWLSASEMCQRIGIDRPNISDARAAGRVLRHITQEKRSNKTTLFAIPDQK